MLDEKYLNNLFSLFQNKLSSLEVADSAVIAIAKIDNSPYRILASTILSLRTKDKITYEASMRLFERAPSIHELGKMDEESISNLIKPTGFYKRKASELKKIAKIIESEYNGEIPQNKDELMSLPGVGTKTANLVLGLCFQKPYICVDCHVHRLSNRLGWIKTKTPEESEKELEKVLPVSFWIEINDLFVRYGQNICTPLSPKCSLCPINSCCEKIGVGKER